MSNPVFSRLEKQWSQTATVPTDPYMPQAGYQTPHPGYQSPSAGYQAPQAGYQAPPSGYAGPQAGYPQAEPGQQPYAYPPADQQQHYPPHPHAQQAAGAAYDQRAFQQAQQAYTQPSATSVDTGRMTYDDVIVKTSLSLALLIAVATGSWILTSMNPALGVIVMMVGLIGGLVTALINIFSKTVRPALILTYAALEGLMLGALSQVTEQMIPGVVLQAVVATFVVFAITLALFTSGRVRNSPKLQRFVLISLLGIIGSRLAIWLLSLVGVNMSWVDGPLFLGLPLGVFISLFAVVIGALSLIGDFDQVKIGVEQGVPTKYAWMSAFGIMVTLIWLYVEILNLLVRLNQRN